MKKLIIITLLATSLVGCKHTQPDVGLAKPVALPALPPYLSKKAERLPDLTDPSMGAAHIDGAETDIKYNEVAHQLNTLIEVYECVKEALATDKDPGKCLKEVGN